MQTKNLIVEKSLDFSVEAIKFCELLETQRKFVVAKQLLRSSTSVGANVFKPSTPKAALISFIK